MEISADESDRLIPCEVCLFIYSCTPGALRGSGLNQTEGQGCRGEAMILVLQGGVVTTLAGYVSSLDLLM